MDNPQAPRSGRQIAADIFTNISKAFTPTEGPGAAIAKAGSTLADAIKKKRKQGIMDKLNAQQDSDLGTNLTLGSNDPFSRMS